MEPKVLFVLIDGLADSANVELDGKTYIEAANTPSLDRLMNVGLSGIMDPVETGLACGSDTAHMSIFGYSPYQYYEGRGSFESMGAGLDLNSEEIAFKCNFATIDPDSGVVLRRRVSRKFNFWGVEMIDCISGKRVPGFEDYFITVKHATEHRCGLKITGPNLSHHIEGTDPLKDHLLLQKSRPIDDNNLNAVKTSLIVNAVSDMIFQVLSKHPINLERIKNKKNPANIILLRGAGVRLNVRKFDEVYAFKSFFIAPTAIIKGWGITIGCDIIEVPGATGDVFSKHHEKFKTATELLKNTEYNFGFLHIKAIDDLGHDKNYIDRIKIFEKIDEMIGNYLFGLENTVVVVTGDHSTNILIGDHSYEPVPFVMALVKDLNKQVEIKKYCETQCARGGLGRFPGSQVMPLLKKFMKFVGTENALEIDNVE